MHSRGLHKKTDEGTSQIKNNIKKKDCQNIICRIEMIMMRARGGGAKGGQQNKRKRKGRLILV